MKKKVLCLFSVMIIVLMAFSTFTPAVATAQAAEPNQEVTVDQAVLDEMQTQGSASYWIQFKNTVDLSPAYSMDWSERGWFVYETLQKQADETQAPVRSFLAGSNVDYKSYWINNSILVTNSTNAVLNAILNFNDVESIGARKTYFLYEPDTSAAITDNGLNAIEPNLTHINADDVWALGIDGTGLVVANIDTGVRYTHQALVGSYRGNNGDGTYTHNYNWFNPDTHSDNVPRDGHGHGTHTMGTMVGDDGGSNQIGIAPGAEWMACSGCPDGSCTDSALLGCGEFIAAPTKTNGTDANPDMRPNVVNNSWGDCQQTYDDWYEDVIDSWLAAGVYPVFSNGNASNCGYSAPPGLNTVGNPARSGDVTGVGSSGEQNGLYATHSNWGPTDNLDTINPVDTYANMKPQVLAPGVSIRSSVATSNTSYEDGWTGTSMSAPHVTGLVALIWQEAPCMIGDYAATETLIESTAVDITYNDGSPLTPSNFPNFATGWGEIDALAAVNMASGMCSTGTLEGKATTDGTTPIEGVQILANNGIGYTTTFTTGVDGTYSIGLPDGTYTLTATKHGYQSQTVTGVVVTEDASTTQNFIMPQLEMSLVSGTVYDGGMVGVGTHGYPLYAAIHITATGVDQTIYTDPFTGYYEIELVESTPHTFEVSAIANGYSTLTNLVTPIGATFTKDFALQVGAACSAPGYIIASGVDEGFESGVLPDGWVNYDYLSNGQIWRFDDPGGWGNLTPGQDGKFAILDSDKYGSSSSQNAGLRTPALDFSGESSVTLEFDTAFRQYTSSTATVRISTDNGVTWTNVWSTAINYIGRVTLDISAQAAGHASVIVEFRYIGSWGWYWQVDDVLITPLVCELVAGGVVAGYVYDANDSSPLLGADVYSDEIATQTFFVPGDPASAGLYWAFHPTTTSPEDVGLTASMQDYTDETEIVSVVEDSITQQDFYLGIGILTVYPTAIDVVMLLGDNTHTETLHVCNTGSAPLNWELIEAENALPTATSPDQSPEAIAKDYPLQYLADGSIDCAYYTDYTGVEPVEVAHKCGSNQVVQQTSAPSGPTDLGYAQDIGYISDNFVSFTLNNFTGQTIIATSTNIYYGMDFDSSAEILYALDDTTNKLGTINLTTGVFTPIVDCPPGGGTDSWTGLSIDPVTNEFFGSTPTALYSINPSTGVSTLIGSFGSSLMIDIAINKEGEIYGHDIGTDAIYSINRATGAATLIGLTGYNANYAQGMDFDNDTDTLYIFLYIGSGANVYGTVNLATGAITPLATSAPQGEFEGAIKVPSFPYDIPWASEDPLAGTLAADTCTDVIVTFDSTGLALGDYFGFLRVKNPPASPKQVSLTLHVVDVLNFYLPLILK